MAQSACCLSKLLRLSARNEFEEYLPHKNGRVEGHVVCGPSSCGKTSLLFEYAFSCAENEDYVLFVSPKPLVKLPLFVNGRTQPNSVVLKRINIAYLGNYVELTEYFANAHLDRIKNSSLGKTRHVLIDDFDWYFREKGTWTQDITRFAECFAYIVDAIEFWSKHMQSSLETKCSLLLSETVAGDTMSTDKIGLYKHWVSEFMRIQELGNSLFRIHPFEHGKDRDNLSSDLTVCYEIKGKEIKIREDARVTDQYFNPDSQVGPVDG